MQLNKVIIVLLFCGMWSCAGQDPGPEKPAEQPAAVPDTQLAREVVNETLRSWQAYKQYAWGADVLKPLSKGASNWYEEPLYISPIDAYSTLFLMGLEEEAREIESYVVDSLDFDKNIDAKVFEVNIRILGGLLSMYELSGNPQVLAKARDFADRMLPAFDTETGVPTYWVNLKTGAVKGDTVNLAEAGTYLLEMGVLSYYSQDPKYYQAAKKATLAAYERRSDKNLLGDIINVQTGELVSTNSHICAGADSYYEYLYKSYLLFGDESIKTLWDTCITAIQEFLPEYIDDRLWYGRVDMETGLHNSAVITLYDAFMPAILAISGHLDPARELQSTWDWLWHKYGIEPMVYDYKKDTANYPVYALNPEIMESAYYLFELTGDSTYYHRNRLYWQSLKAYCKTEVAFTSLENVETKEQQDYMPTFFFAETLKYLYLTFSRQSAVDLDSHVFTTEAHPFKKSNFDPERVKTYLGIQ